MHTYFQPSQVHSATVQSTILFNTISFAINHIVLKIEITIFCNFAEIDLL